MGCVTGHAGFKTFGRHYLDVQQQGLSRDGIHQRVEMGKRDAKKGLATLCVGGGMGVAMCVERE